MKKISLLCLCLLAGILGNVNAQDKWSVGFHYSAVDFILPNANDKDTRGEPYTKTEALKTKNWNEGVGISIGYRVMPLLNVAANYSLGRIDKPFTAQTATSSISHVATLNVELHPIQEKWFDPYIFAGGGFHRAYDYSYGAGGGGLGLNFWLSEGAAFSVQTMYNASQFDNFWHHQIGLKFNLGKAKDTDGDGISDKKDICPDVAGKIEFMGCPDSDNDGVKDSEDKCPQVAGLKELGGCPDQDADGITDAEDKCPSLKGTAQYQGCPDSDGDTVVDPDDKCPNEAGVVALQGCPDKDSDGVADADDKCPTQAGKANLQGCPDRDGDNIADADDKCPDVAGVKEEQGCPSKRVTASQVSEVEDKLAMAAKSINFQVGSNIITKDSYDDLDQVLAILKQYPESKFSIEGHTDNVGNAAQNKALSQRRADAVKKYFTDKKIDTKRIAAKGFGSEKAIGDNKTKEGQAKNRRVEIHLEK
jgi:OmpA-OmpF porin, OOP family